MTTAVSPAFAAVRVPDRLLISILATLGFSSQSVLTVGAATAPVCTYLPTSPRCILGENQGKLEPSPSGGPLFPAAPALPTGSAVSDISPDLASAAAYKMASLSDVTSAAVAAEAAAADAAAVAAAAGGRSSASAAAEAVDAAEASGADDDGDTDRNAADDAAAGEQGAGSGAERPSVVIVGAGPAGLFAALELVEAGMKPVIVERGM